jgi:hypothetical protein
MTMTNSQKPENSEWSPTWAPHVKGIYPSRTFDPITGQPDEQKISIQCQICGATWQVICTSGLVRSHISNFAKSHLHRDPFEVSG